jgi:hypothetical protein
MVVYIVILIAVVLAVRFYITQKKAAEKLRERELSFLVPKEGGVLQKMKKDQDGNIKLRLGKKIKITHDTYIFRFSFEDPDYTFGLPIGGHVIFSAETPTPENPKGELVQRKYTPISTI